MTTELRVTVERVVFPPPDADEPLKGGWMLIITDEGMCKGEVAWRPSKGEKLTLTGETVVYQGKRQFAFTAAHAYLPVEAKSTLEYAAQLTKGIGDAMCKAIYEKWGESWADDIEPGEVKGYTIKVHNALLDTLATMATRREQSQAMTYLMSMGATYRMAELAWIKWKKEVVGIVRSDCYRLAELPRMGFQSVDREVRRRFGIMDNDDRRVRAGVMYAMDQETSRGSTVIPWTRLGAKAVSLLATVSLAQIAGTVKAMMEEGALASFPKVQGLSLRTHYEAEAAIWEYCDAT